MSRSLLPTVKRRLCGLICQASAVILLLSVSPGVAQRGPEGPFAALPGSWAGTGTITMSSGVKERIRCEGDYRLQSRTSVRLQLTCASDSYRFELRSEAVADGQRLTGTWTERSRRVSGQIFGRLLGPRMEVRAESQTFNALLDMTTRGNRQQVTIRSPGSEMSAVSISLSRRPR
jgi:hypothetical protein